MTPKCGWETPDLTRVRPEQLWRAGRAILRALDAGDLESPACRVFQSEDVSEGALTTILAKDDLQVLERCRVLQSDGRTFRCPFHAHVLQGLLVFSDPRTEADQHAPNYVDPLWEAPYLAKLLVRGRVRTALDMGCGCGALGLIMASYAEQVTGVDFNPRAAVLSRLNAALNGIRNATFL